MANTPKARASAGRARHGIRLGMGQLHGTTSHGSSRNADCQGVREAWGEDGSVSAEAKSRGVPSVWCSVAGIRHPVAQRCQRYPVASRPVVWPLGRLWPGEGCPTGERADQAGNLVTLEPDVSQLFVGESRELTAGTPDVPGVANVIEKA